MVSLDLTVNAYQPDSERVGSYSNNNKKLYVRSTMSSKSTASYTRTVPFCAVSVSQGVHHTRGLLQYTTQPAAQRMGGKVLQDSYTTKENT